jgi:hypothetical protein
MSKKVVVDLGGDETAFFQRDLKALSKASRSVRAKDARIAQGLPALPALELKTDVLTKPASTDQAPTETEVITPRKVAEAEEAVAPLIWTEFAQAPATAKAQNEGASQSYSCQDGKSLIRFSEHCDRCNTHHPSHARAMSTCKSNAMTSAGQVRVIVHIMAATARA